MTVLRVLRWLPPSVLEPPLAPVLGLYPLLRPAHARRLRASFAASPHRDAISMRAYYRMRLRLLLGNLRQHGRAVPPGNVVVTGWEHYRAVLAAGRPVALLGLHAGLLELLHRVPEPPDGRPFLILTAPAFAPALSDFMARGREREGKKVLWNRKAGRPGPDAVPGLESGLRAAIRAKGVLALMADQHPGPASDSEFLDLWGSLRVPYPARLLRFLARKDFLFAPVSTALRPDGSSSFRFHPPWDPAASAAGNGGLADRLRAFLEEGVSAAPDQWNWSYPKIHAVPPASAGKRS